MSASQSDLKKRPDIFSIQLDNESKRLVDRLCVERGMTLKGLLGALVVWFSGLDKTEQSLILEQFEAMDVEFIADLVVSRNLS